MGLRGRDVMVVDGSAELRGLIAHTRIQTRKDLNRWGMRVGKENRYAFWSLLLGTTISLIITLYFGASFASKHEPDLLESFNYLPYLFGMVVGSVFFGVMTFIASLLMLKMGLRSYHHAVAWLRTQNRVYTVCERVALFDDNYVNPSKEKNHTTADLVPHMNTIEEDGETNVLCDACLAEVEAMDSA